MKILVCISSVPDTTAKITFTNNNTEFNNTGVQFIINPYDEIALAKAAELCEGGKGGITVLHVGEAPGDALIRKALALGADEAVRVNAAARDAFFVSGQIAALAAGSDYDLILFGQESIDYNGGQVGAMTAERLGIPFLSQVKKLEIRNGTALLERQGEEGREVIEAGFPLALGCSEGLAEPRIPNMRGIMAARTKPLRVVGAQEFPVLQRISSYQLPPPREKVKMIPAGEAERLIELLREEAKVI